MNGTRIIISIIVTLCGWLIPAQASVFSFDNDKKKTERKSARTIYGGIVNSVTGLGMKDSIRVELLTSDSIPVDFVYPNFGYRNYPDESTISTGFNMNTECKPGDYLLRLSHPDYDTATYPLQIDRNNINAGTLNIRKLTSFEKAVMLGEVTVTASKVQFVNRGDTISYNADAFDVAQGSMLDALLRQMPGVQLRENGQIYVNGRFVDKLLLDGKDFFKGDKLVLLQNLPSYTVKNVKVYEEASGETRVLGKGAMDARNPDPYVMDVVLKKGYNAGWMANAEASTGTRGRYRERLFGSMYTSKFRLSAYGMMNDLNETGTPGSGGSWESPDEMSGEKSTRGAGMDYGYFKPDNSLELNGSVSIRRVGDTQNQFTNRQNFLSGGDTYTRTWTDSYMRDLSVNTNHSITLQPRQGNSYYTNIQLLLNYNDTKTRNSTTEGNFNRDPGEIDGLREKLTRGLPEELEATNRMVSSASSRSKPLKASWRQNSVFQFGESNHGVSIRSNGFYERSSTENGDNYLLQFAGEEPRNSVRSNPVGHHAYRYWVGPRFTFALSPYIYFNPQVVLCHYYENNRNMWNVSGSGDNTGSLEGDGETSGVLLPDPVNSFHAASHHTHEFISAALSYYRKTQRDGRDHSSISVYVQPGFNLVQRKLTYTRVDVQRIRKNYVTPETMMSVFWFLPGMAPRLNLEYKFTGAGPSLMDLVDNTFTYDPLNLRMGARDLVPETEHRFDLGYESRKLLFDRLMLSAYLAYTVTRDKISMAYSLDRETGVRIFRPTNVNGNRTGWLSVLTDLYIDRKKRLKFNNWLWLQPVRSVDMISTDSFMTSTKSVVNSFVVRNTASVEYNNNGHMAAIEGSVDSRKARSAMQDFVPFRVTRFNYGLRGRLSLPAGFEISTDLKMYSTRGFDDPSMNLDQVVWNARISKSLLKGRLIIAADGYDLLRNISNVSYSVNAQGRTEKWVNNIPSYLLFSIRWSFSKKPRE